MDPPQATTTAKPATERARLQQRYGNLPSKAKGGTLLNHQLEGRKYFDSGDYALSQAEKSSNIGSIETGREHPLRENISHPSCPVPGSSNVEGDANQQAQGEKDAVIGQADEEDEADAVAPGRVEGAGPHQGVGPRERPKQDGGVR